MPEKTSQPINFRLKAWQEIAELSQDIAEERGIEKQDLTKTVMEAIHFFKLWRGKVGLPGENS